MKVMGKSRLDHFLKNYLASVLLLIIIMAIGLYTWYLGETGGIVATLFSAVSIIVLIVAAMNYDKTIEIHSRNEANRYDTPIGMYHQRTREEEIARQRNTQKLLSRQMLFSSRQKSLNYSRTGKRNK